MQFVKEESISLHKLTVKSLRNSICIPTSSQLAADQTIARGMRLGGSHTVVR
jgi:hypothetical protein